MFAASTETRSERIAVIASAGGLERSTCNHDLREAGIDDSTTSIPSSSARIRAAVLTASATRDVMACDRPRSFTCTDQMGNPHAKSGQRKVTGAHTGTDDTTDDRYSR